MVAMTSTINNHHPGHCRNLKLMLLLVIAVFGMASTSKGTTKDSALRTPPACRSLSDTNPLHVLLLGDSIVWGQGLAEDHKFSYLVQEWLCQKTDRKVIVTREAHSGATIRADEESCPTAGGEVNISQPTILDQVKSARRFYTDGSQVDLVLIDGCINDVNFRNIINPEITKDKLADIINKKCGEPSRELLERVTESFPNAWVIITGYYPIVTEKSAKNLAMRLLIRSFQPADAEEKFSIIKNDRARFRHLVEMSRFWQWQSSANILNSVMSINQALTNKGEPARIWYVEAPGTGPLNGFSAPESLMWTLGFNSTGKAFLAKGLKVITLGRRNWRPNDEQFILRRQSCRAVAKACPEDFQGTRAETLMKRLACEYAAFGHPNREGARRYAEGIIRRLDYLIKNIGWLREMKN